MYTYNNIYIYIYILFVACLLLGGFKVKEYQLQRPYGPPHYCSFKSNGLGFDLSLTYPSMAVPAAWASDVAPCMATCSTMSWAPWPAACNARCTVSHAAVEAAGCTR